MKSEDILGPQPRPIWTILATVGLIIVVAATFIPIYNMRETPYMMQDHWFGYLYAAGALMLVVCRLNSRYKGCVDRVKRLSRIELWSAIFFCVAAFFLFYTPNSPRDWMAFTLAGGAIQIYTSIAIPLALRKALKKQQ